MGWGKRQGQPKGERRHPAPHLPPFLLPPSLSHGPIHLSLFTLSHPGELLLYGVPPAETRLTVYRRLSIPVMMMIIMMIMMMVMMMLIMVIRNSISACTEGLLLVV